MDADSWTVRDRSSCACTRSFSPQCWVRSRSPIHRGGDERTSERGRACALATPVIRASLYGRHNGPRNRHQKRATGIARQLARADERRRAVRSVQTQRCVLGRSGSHGRRQGSKSSIGSSSGSGFARSAIRPVPQQGGQSDRISSVRRADRMESLKERKAANPAPGHRRSRMVSGTKIRPGWPRA